MPKDFSGENWQRLTSKSGCLLCAWGNDLPPGEYCRACGCESLPTMGAIVASLGHRSVDNSASRTRIFSHPTGPLVEWDGRFLHVEDLNPHVQTRWRMSRWELLAFGWKAIKSALRPALSSSERTER